MKFDNIVIINRYLLWMCLYMKDLNIYLNYIYIYMCVKEYNIYININ